FQQDGAKVVPKPHSARTVLKFSSERTKNVGNAVDALNVSRRSSYDKERAGGQDRVCRKGIIERARQAVAAKVGKVSLRVVEFDELDVFAITTRSRMIHDFRNDETGATARRAERLATTCGDRYVQR